MDYKTGSLKLKLRKLIFNTSGIALLLASLVFFVFEYYTFRDTEKQNLITLAKVIASNSSAPLAFVDKKNAAEILGALSVEGHITKACLYDSGGLIFARYPQTSTDSIFPPVIKREKVFYAGTSLECFEPVMQANAVLGTLYLHSDLSIIYSRFLNFVLVALLVVGISIGISVILSRRLQLAISSPILELSDGARSISSRGDYSFRAKPSAIQEANVLTTAFNQMLDQIETQNLAITKFNQELENKIKERTQELAGINQTLQKQNELVGTILDSSVDLIAVLDSRLRYMVVNKAAIQSYGKPPESLLNQYLFDVFPDLLSGPMKDDLQSALNGQLIHIEQYHSPVLDRYFDSFYIPLFDKSGRVERILIIAHDITTMMESNRSLAELNTELKISNEHLGQFAYITSHDLQEPLRKIQTFAELVESNMSDQEFVRKYLGKIRTAAFRMSDLVRSVLEYSRSTASQDSFVPTDLNQILEGCKLDLEISIGNKHALIESDRLPVILGLSPQIGQLFLNLLSNSIKFCDGQPVITIRSRLLGPQEDVSKKHHFNNGCVLLSFQDNGIGFEQKYADRIFNIFGRLHDSKKYPGTGVGLALCKKIVEMHKGAIEVNSVPGQGTTIKIYFPALLLVNA